MALAEIVLKLTLVIFMLGNLLDMGLRLHLSDALRDLRNLRVRNLEHPLGVRNAAGARLCDRYAYPNGAPRKQRD